MSISTLYIKKTYRTGITKQDPKNYCSDDDDDYIEKLTYPLCYYCPITKKKDLLLLLLFGIMRGLV